MKRAITRLDISDLDIVALACGMLAMYCPTEQEAVGINLALRILNDFVLYGEGDRKMKGIHDAAELVTYIDSMNRPNKT